MDKVLLVGFSGKIGSGKDYVAKNIFLPLLEKKQKIKYAILAFADSLKSECSLRYGYNYDKLYNNKDTLVRERLKLVGDEYRSKYGKNVFVNNIKLQIELLKNKSDINTILITDVRYPEEMKFIKEYGGKIYRVNAKNRTNLKIKKECKNIKKNIDKISNALSETLLDKEKFDGYINNDFNDNPVEECIKLL